MAYSHSLHNNPAICSAFKKNKPFCKHSVIFPRSAPSLLSVPPWKAASVATARGGVTHTKALRCRLETMSPSGTFAFSHIKNSNSCSSSSSSALFAGLAGSGCEWKPEALCPAPLLLLAAANRSGVLSREGTALPAPSVGAGGWRRLLRRSLEKRFRGQRPLAGLATASPVSTLVSAACRRPRLSWRGACSPRLACRRREVASHHDRAAGPP